MGKGGRTELMEDQIRKKTDFITAREMEGIKAELYRSHFRKLNLINLT